jgi:hypothetical protein
MLWMSLQRLADFIDKLMAPAAAARHKNTQEILEDLANISQELSQPQIVTNLGETTTSQASVDNLPSKSRENPNKFIKFPGKWLLGWVVGLSVGLGGYGTWQVYQNYNPKALSLVTTIDGHSSYVNYLVNQC